MSDLLTIPVERVEIADGNPRARVSEAGLRELVDAVAKSAAITVPAKATS